MYYFFYYFEGNYWKLKTVISLATLNRRQHFTDSTVRSEWEDWLVLMSSNTDLSHLQNVQASWEESQQQATKFHKDSGLATTTAPSSTVPVVYPACGRAWGSKRGVQKSPAATANAQWCLCSLGTALTSEPRLWTTCIPRSSCSTASSEKCGYLRKGNTPQWTRVWKYSGKRLNYRWWSYDL